MSNLHINPQIKIMSAKSQHLDDIFTLSQLYALSNLSQEVGSEQGFFISNFSRQAYEKFIQQNHIFWILLEKGKLRAFLLAIDPAKQILDQTLDGEIKEYGINQYLIIKQICTHPEHTSKGIASYLYKAFIDKYGHIPLVAAIVTSPSNPRSIALHKKLGFEWAFRYVAPDELPRSIWIRAKRRWKHGQ
jgi:ribosomal protein S18 acetylase RimI-like enzyme